MLFIFVGDLIFTRLILSIFFIFWSRITILLHWNSILLVLDIYTIFVLNFYSYILLYYTIILWFILYNLGGILLFYEISFLNVFVLAVFLISIFFTYLIHFLSGFYYYLFAHLLCGDEFMDVLIIRFLLCILECFSLICRCCALFLRLFCNLLASHFLLTLFLDFIYFFLCFLWFFSFLYFYNFIFLLVLSIALLVILLFYSFLIILDSFSAILQIYILISMLHLGVSDWCIFKHIA